MASVKGYYRFPSVSKATVVFVAEDDLWTVPLDGGVAHRVTANPGSVSWPRISPDGDRIAYTSRDEGQPDVWVIDTDGGPARRLTYFGTLARCVGWDGADRVIVATDWHQPFEGWLHLMSVDVESGHFEPLDVGPAGAWARGRPGTVVGRLGRDPAQWKRYRGGRKGRLFVDRAGEGLYEPFDGPDGNLSSPMWIERRLYFLSDHEGHGNLYSATPTGRNVERHTHHEGFYARNAATDGRTIVYHQGAEVWRFDVAAGRSDPIDVRLPSSQPQRARRFEPPGKRLEGIQLHPEGHSVAVVARGSATTMPLWEGAPRALRRSHGARDRLVSYLSGGTRLVGITDEAGEEAVFVVDADDPHSRRLVLEGIGRARTLTPAPHGADRVVIENHRHELLIGNLDSGNVRRVHHSPYSWTHGAAWSPDGRWVAFAASVSPRTAAVFVADARTGRTRQVTSGAFFDARPSFSADGKYLYFLSSRTYEPIADSIFHDYGFPRSFRPYALPLTAATVSPFAAEQRLPRPPGGGASNDNAADQPPRVTIDFEEISQRVVAFPVPAGRYGRVEGASAERVLFSSYPMRSATDRGPVGGKIEMWDPASGKVEQVADGVTDFTVSSNRAVLAYLAEKKLRVLQVGHKGGDKNGTDAPGRESGWVDLSRVRVEVDPPAEWRQMLREAWRLQRDHFWREDMAEVDWEEVLVRHMPLVDRVATRSEFSDLVWAMQGELGTSHAYEMGGDYRPEPPWKQGELGADLRRLRSGAWEIARIPIGDPWDERRTSPLAVPGLDIRAGDRILAVDGIRVDGDVSPYQALVDRADAAVPLTLRRGRGRSRHVVIKALASETPLRYRVWVDENRRRVHEATDGAAGYLHIPDMGPNGFAEFHRSWRAEVDSPGLVVDVRFNRGGNVSHLLMQKLVRQRIGYRVTRWGEPRPVPPDAPAGPMVALTNELCGSDGDIFSHTFKLYGLGPLIGVRTWGGVVGIWPQQSLVDGTITTQPEYGSWFTDVGFGIENYGAEPDIEVENLPQDHREGIDRQLERAISEIMELIDGWDALLPEFGSHPSMRAPELPRVEDEGAS